MGKERIPLDLWEASLSSGIFGNPQGLYSGALHPGQWQGQLGVLRRWLSLMGSPLFNMIVDRKAQRDPVSGMTLPDSYITLVPVE